MRILQFYILQVSTSRRQRVLQLILHAEGKEIFYPVYKDLQGIPGIPAARPSKGIPVIHDIPDIPVIHDISTSRHYYMFQYVPAPPSTLQYIPVLSSTSSVSNASRDSTHSSISSDRMQILFIDWFPLETSSSTS